MTTTPRWLNADEQHTWLAFLYAHRLLFEQIERDLQREAGMPLAYYQILVVLSAHPDRTMRMSELADASSSSRSRLSHTIDRLEASGWVRREVCPSDRRGALAVLTDEGMAVLEAAAPDHVESVRTHLFDQLSPAEVTNLREVSQTLVRHLLASLGRPPSFLPEAYGEVEAT